MKKFKYTILEKTPSGKVQIELIYKSGLQLAKGESDLALSKSNLIAEVRQYLKSDKQQSDPLVCAHCFQANIGKGYVVYANEAFKLIPKMVKGTKLKVPFKIINKAFREWLLQKRAILYAINEEDLYVI